MAMELPKLTNRGNRDIGLFRNLDCTCILCSACICHLLHLKRRGGIRTDRRPTSVKHPIDPMRYVKLSSCSAQRGPWASKISLVTTTCQWKRRLAYYQTCRQLGKSRHVAPTLHSVAAIKFKCFNNKSVSIIAFVLRLSAKFLVKME